MHIEVHSIAVHFPIALVAAAVLLDWGRWVFGREGLLTAGFWGGSTPLLIGALLGTLVAITTGLITEEGVRQTEAISELLDAHELMAFVGSGLLALLCFWRLSVRGAFPATGRLVYLILLLANLVVIGYGSYFGGLLVYSHGVGVDVPWRLIP